METIFDEHVDNQLNKERLTVEDLIRLGTIDRTTAGFIEKCVLAKTNIIISGGTGSGKTTTLNIVSGFIPRGERVITIEDSLELQLNAPHVVTLEAKCEIPVQQLIKQGLRMRPDRIIVGEVRDASALDLLDAMNTGYEGSVGTVHSNSPSSCIIRLENLIRRTELELDTVSIRQIIADGLDIIIQIARLRDHSHKITHVSQVSGYDKKSRQIIVEDLFRWTIIGEKNGKLLGKFRYTGAPLNSKLKRKFSMHGIDLAELIK